MSKTSRQQKLINEMGVGMGGVAGGMERLGDPATKLAQGAFGEDDLDMGPPDDELGGEGLGDELGEEEDSVECSKGELRELLDAVEMGEKSAEEAFDQLCMGGEEECGMGADELGDELGGGGGMDDLGGLDSPVGGVSAGPGLELEDVQRIASILTEDPDIFSS
jgi:hypothetical protein